MTAVLATPGRRQDVRCGRPRSDGGPRHRLGSRRGRGRANHGTIRQRQDDIALDARRHAATFHGRHRHRRHQPGRPRANGNYRAFAEHLGFVFQDFNLLGALTALENVSLACNLAGVTGIHTRQRATELLQRFNLGERLQISAEAVGRRTTRGGCPSARKRTITATCGRTNGESRLEDRPPSCHAAPRHRSSGTPQRRRRHARQPPRRNHQSCAVARRRHHVTTSRRWQSIPCAAWPCPRTTDRTTGTTASRGGSAQQNAVTSSLDSQACSNRTPTRRRPDSSSAAQ